VNFIINIPGTRPIGMVDKLKFSAFVPMPAVLRTAGLRDAELHHLEYRHDYETGGDFVALIYKLPDRS
jgi:hypothetical protein